MGGSSDTVLAAIPEVPTSPAITKPTIEAVELSPSDFEKIELLDMGKHNWPTWSEAMMNLFFLNACGGYVLGTLVRPTDSPESAATWDVNNLCIIDAMKMRCTREQIYLVCNAINAKDAWTILRTRHEKLGLVAQSLLVQEALSIHFQRSDRFATTATRLHDLVDRIFAAGFPKQDDFLLIVLMNALSTEFPALRDHIADCINGSSVLDPYTSTHASRYLDMVQQRIESEKQHQSGGIAPRSNGAVHGVTATVTRDELRKVREAHKLKMNDLQAKHDRIVRAPRMVVDTLQAPLDESQQDVARKSSTSSKNKKAKIQLLD